MRAFINKIEKNFNEKDNITQNIRYCHLDYYLLSFYFNFFVKTGKKFLTASKESIS
jgi:hypothetical protein